MTGTVRDMLAQYEAKDFLEYEGIEYKETQGSRGIQLQIKTCPACGDSRWKVYLNESDGLGNCFRCDLKFNKWTFAEAVYGVSDKRTVAANIETMVRQMGWRPPVTERPPVVEMDTNNILFPRNCIDLPTKDGQNLKYLEERGVTSEYCEYFHLKYCGMKAWWKYTKADGSPGSKNFEKRVIIPVLDLDGKLVNFQGRDITGQAEQKYLFPPRLKGTGRFLYNGHNAVPPDITEVILNEGVFDVIATKKALDSDGSISGVVPIGSFGKNLSYGGDESQLSNFARLKGTGVNKVTVMWDGESSALNKAIDACKMLRGLGLETAISLLPKGKDPAEISGDQVRRVWREALPFTDSLAVKLKIHNPYT